MIIRVDTKEAVRLLKQHREEHIKEYAVQMQGWKIAMEEYKERLSVWSKGIPEDVLDGSPSRAKPAEPVKPMDFIKSYDRYLNMLGYHTAPTIDLEESEFIQIIDDDFGWKNTFLSNSAVYGRR